MRGRVNTIVPTFTSVVGDKRWKGSEATNRSVSRSRPERESTSKECNVKTVLWQCRTLMGSCDGPLPGTDGEEQIVDAISFAEIFKESVVARCSPSDNGTVL